MPLFLIFALFAAVHSELGRHIGPGESPGFAWVRDHIGLGLGVMFAARMVAATLQIGRLRRSTSLLDRGLRLLVGIELLCMGAVIGVACSGAKDSLSLIATFYLLVVLLQGAGGLARGDFIPKWRQAAAGIRSSGPTPWFFGWLFLLGGLTAVIDPSWRRMTDQTAFDTALERVLHLALPAWIGGGVTLWLGIGLAGGAFLFTGLKRRAGERAIPAPPLLLGALVLMPGLFSALLLAALMHAVSWQAGALNLRWAGIQLLLIFTTAGSALLALVFIRLVQRWPKLPASGPLTVMCLTLGAALIWPLTRLLTSKYAGGPRLRTLAGMVSTTCLLGILLVLFGDLFNPWYSAFSYLKGSLVALLSVVAAGSGALAMERDKISRRKSSAKSTIVGIKAGGLLLLAGLMGAGPFWTLDAYPEVKAALLQYNELVRVETGVVRVIADTIGLGHRVRLGQTPPPNGAPDPWPTPWKLKKTHASLLPADFNLLIIVVDALRGDAFSSAGYPRKTTPHLDRWALSEAISFRRAYSQGGGTFAALPFLVGGRSRFALYGPQLYHRNLYLKLARAEKIDQLWITGHFGPRAIFPPDVPVKPLEVNRAVSDRHTATADEAFAALDRAIDQLPSGERFLCFLHLMDVHNDLWKKNRGIDFGNRPRELYDNNLSYLDGACARFFKRLKSKGLYDRTVILLTADHGEQFWEHGASLHGHTLYEEEIRVPLILLVHGLVKRFEDVPVLSSDMAPTIVDLAGYAIDPPYVDRHMGISLRPLILNDDKAPYLHRTITGRASFKRRYLWYRDWEWKLIYSAQLDVLQLFNVVRDPQERRNLLQEEPSLAAQMEAELLDYLGRVEGRRYFPVISRRAR
ncbi:MAG: sulfatase-like hydrolase/transferase [Desulfosarcinaceae bacterium]